MPMRLILRNCCPDLVSVFRCYSGVSYRSKAVFKTSLALLGKLLFEAYKRSPEEFKTILDQLNEGRENERGGG